MPRMQNNIPARKVVAGSLGGALTTILVYFAEVSFLSEPLPSAIVGALTTVISFIVGYMVPPSENDRIVP